jgi:hypothetical protein
MTVTIATAIAFACGLIAGFAADRPDDPPAQLRLAVAGRLGDRVIRAIPADTGHVHAGAAGAAAVCHDPECGTRRRAGQLSPGAW